MTRKGPTALVAGLVAASLVTTPASVMADAPGSSYPGTSGTVVDRGGDGHVPTRRFAGLDRFDTAELIASSGFHGASTALVARGDLFPDALAGTYLAGQLNAPILLTPSDQLGADAADALAHLGVDNVIVLGAEAAVSAAVETSLDETYAVDRVGGIDRYETAALIARRGPFYGELDGERVAFVASGDDFPDALVAGAIAYEGQFPLLLTTAVSLPQVTAQALTDLSIDRVVVTGGPVAVNESVTDAIAGLGIDVERVQGPSRVETAIALSDWTERELGWLPGHVNIARGDLFPDALAIGPHAGDERAPVLLTNNSQDAGQALLEHIADRDACELLGIDVAGGTAAIAAAVEDAIRAAADAPATPCRLALLPQRASRVAGATHTVVADVRDQNAAGVPSSVRFEVRRAVESGGGYALVTSVLVATDPEGRATFSYAGPQDAALDVVIACVPGAAHSCAQVPGGGGTNPVAAPEVRDDQGNCDATDLDLVDCAEVTWRSTTDPAPGQLQLTPPSVIIPVAVGSVGTHTVTADLTSGGEAAADQLVHFEVYRDLDADGTYDLLMAMDQFTDQGGDATLTYDGPGYRDADDVIVACTDTGGCGVAGVDDEPGTGADTTLTMEACGPDDDTIDCASAAWRRQPGGLTLSPQTSSTALEPGQRGEHRVVARVADAVGIALPGEQVGFEVYRDTDGDLRFDRVATGGGTADDDGEAELTYDGSLDQVAHDVIVACVLVGGATGCDAANEPPGDAESGDDTTIRRAGGAGCDTNVDLVDCADQQWTLAAASLLLSPQTNATEVDAGDQGSHTVTAHVADQYGGDFGGQLVRFDVYRDVDGDGSYDVAAFATDTTGPDGDAAMQYLGPEDDDADDVIVACTVAAAADSCEVADEPPGDPTTGDDTDLDRDGADGCDASDADLVDCADQAWSVKPNPDAPAALTLSPESAINPIDAPSHTVTATLVDAEGDPNRGVLLRFEVYRDTDDDGSYDLIRTRTDTTGDDVDDDGDGADERTGEATLDYAGPGAGPNVEDVIVACIAPGPCGIANEPPGDPSAGEDTTLNRPGCDPAGDLVACADKGWEIRVASALTLAPPTDVKVLGSVHRLLATVTDQFGDGVAGATVTFEVYRLSADTPPYAPVLPAAVDDTGDDLDDDGQATDETSGSATFDYTGPLTPAVDVVVACIETADADPTCATVNPLALPAAQVVNDPDDPLLDRATVNWVPLAAGQGLIGAAKVSIYPRPDLYVGRFPGARWERDEDLCTTLDEDAPQGVDHPAVAGSPWPENPDCLYQGGFGIGPVNPITSWDRAPGDVSPLDPVDDGTGNGLWVRSVAIRDAQNDTTVLTIIDAASYLGDYARKCQHPLAPGDVPVVDQTDCGFYHLATSLGDTYEIPPSGLLFSSTHSHAAPDLIGGWGFVPDWYMAQVEDALRQSVAEAIANMRPAVVEVGEEMARQFNGERRDTYRAAEEQQLTWFRAIGVNLAAGVPDPLDVIATVGAYAAHPTSFGNNGGEGHADWVGVFEKRLEERWPGLDRDGDTFGDAVGLHFMTGLGNISNNGLGGQGGAALANLIPDPETPGVPMLADTDVRSAQTFWNQPATNVPLTGLGTPGFFDREFEPVPGAIVTGKNPTESPCSSSSPTSVRVAASAIRVGELAITAGPGELFANLTNTIKDRAARDRGARVTMPIAQGNDGLGYIMQAHEIENPAAQQGAGFVFGGVLGVNYEDAYAIDRCFGEMVLEQTLAMLGATGGSGQAVPVNRVHEAPAAPAELLAGAAKINIAPRPEDYQAEFPGARWEQDYAKCVPATIDPPGPGTGPLEGLEHAAVAGSPWLENPDCIYMGGYGIGPLFPITSFDEEYGLWVRSVAIQEPGSDDTLVMTVLDGVYYFGDYAVGPTDNRCVDDDCGFFQIAEELGTELGLDSKSFLFTTTHSHTSPDFIGGWGYVPDWYLAQVGDALRDSVRQAVADLEPAIVEYGEELARPNNSERRNTYRSAEEQYLAWFRPIAKDDGATIATVGSWAAHPVTADESDGVGHPDWVGPFVKQLETDFGGIGLNFMTGFGNVTGANPMTGLPLAALIPDVGAARALTSNDVGVEQSFWRQPASNVPLTSLGLPGFFDRQFDAIPAQLQTGEEPSSSPCLSGSPYSVLTTVTAARIGELAITGGPGELFSNLTNTIREHAARNGAAVTLPLSLVNDGLGYILQNYEMENPASQQGGGFAAAGVAYVEYEDAYSIDRCFGDKVIEETISLLGPPPPP